MTTHYEGCYDGGPKHYECALLEVKRLRAMPMMEFKRREWVGLTDFELGSLTVFEGLHHIETPLLAEFIKAIEAKLKERNCG